MGNTCACTRHLKAVSFSKVRGPSEAEYVAGTATEGAPSSSSPHLPAHSHAMMEKAPESGGVGSVEQQIERSKSHWSLLTESDSDLTDEQVATDNRAAFQTLESHPIWGGFFCTFGYDTKLWHSYGELEVREKFAEGGQAELFHAHVKWRNAEDNERHREHGHEWVLKVFKQGTLLRHLQSQWPLGMFQYRMEQIENWNSPAPQRIPRFNCQVKCGTLLEDGRFAFLLKREQVDLRNLIDRNMMTTSKSYGPFLKKDEEEIMLDVAFGMLWLHNRGIVHRDLKASNMLVKLHNHGHFQCFVADYECSIGVVGTGVFRVPEILEACKDMSVSKRPYLFTKSSDVYSYGMTCYEILTGKLPFDDLPLNDYINLVINGHRPKVPKYVDDWIHGLLSNCWHSNPLARPSFEEILGVILTNSTSIANSRRR